MDQPSDPGVTSQPAPAGEMSALLADAQGRVVNEAVAALERRDQTHRRAASAADRRRYVGDLFGLVAACVRAGGTEPIIASSRQVAADRFAAGFDIAEIQGEFSVLEEVLWRHVGNALAADQRIEAHRLVSTILGAGRDAVARTYVVLASRSGGPLGEQPAAATGDGDAAEGGAGRPGGAVRVDIRRQVGVISLDDKRTRNALSAQTCNGIIAALDRLRAGGVRVVDPSRGGGTARLVGRP